LEKKQIGTGIVLQSIPIPTLNLFVLQRITVYYNVLHYVFGSFT